MSRKFAAPYDPERHESLLHGWGLLSSLWEPCISVEEWRFMREVSFFFLLLLMSAYVNKDWFVIMYGIICITAIPSLVLHYLSL